MSVKSSITETDITAVSIAKDGGLIATASYNKKDLTVSLWYSSKIKDTYENNVSITIDLKEKVPQDKIDLTVSNFIQSLNSSFIVLTYHIDEAKPAIIVLQSIMNDSNEAKPEDVTVNFENDETKAVLDEPIEPQLEVDSDKAKPDKAKPEKAKAACNWEDFYTAFIVFKNGQLQSEENVREDFWVGIIDDGFIGAEFFADGEILAIKYKTGIRFVHVASRSSKWISSASSDQDEEAVLVLNPSRNENYVLLPWRGKRIIDMENIYIQRRRVETTNFSHISNLSKISSIAGKKAVVSFEGYLLAFENGSIVDLKTGLQIANIAEHMLSDMKDYLFVNDDRHLLIVHSAKDENNEANYYLKAILVDAHSGTELKSAKTQPEPELAYLKHIQLIGDYVITVTSNNDDAIIKKRHWKEFFFNQSNNMQLEELQSIEWKTEKGQAKGILLPSYFNFNNFDFDNFDLKEVDTSNADCFFLFWKSNDKTRCLVYNRSAIKIKLDKVDNTLQLYDDKGFYTFLPLYSVIEGKSLPAEWMQSSCNYLKFRSEEPDNIITDTIRLYINNNAFNGTTAICDLIDIGTSDTNRMIKEILTYDKYVPTGFDEKNPLKKAIANRNVCLVGEILEYCLHRYCYDYEPGFMTIVVDSLLELTIHYPKMLNRLLDQCSYLKVPSKWEIGFQEKIASTKDLKYHGLDRRFEKQPEGLATSNPYTDLYSATYCHVPLFNLCKSHMDPTLFLVDLLNLLVSSFGLSHRDESNGYQSRKNKNPLSYDNLSLFAKLSLLQSPELFQSPLFQTIVMHKRMSAYGFICGYLSLYIIYFCLFVAATSTTESNPTSSRRLMIASLFFGSYWALSWFVRLIINLKVIRIIRNSSNKIKKIFMTLIESAALILPFITGCMELSNKTAPPELRSLSILFLWIFIFLQFRIIRKIGIFTAVFTILFNKTWPLLIFLVFILLSFAHSLTVLLSESSPDNGENTFTSFYPSLKNTWAMLLNNYSPLDPWKKNYLLDILMFAFSLTTAIVVFNILIALINSAYEETLSNAHNIWVMEMAEIIAELELNPVFNHNNNIDDGLERGEPWIVIYEAPTKKVEEAQNDKKQS